MRQALVHCLAIAVAFLPSVSPTFAEPAGTVAGPLGEMRGFLWQEGGLGPPSIVGDDLQFVAEFEPVYGLFDLPWEQDQYTYTVWARGMTFADETMLSPELRLTTYDPGGTLGIYREPLPPNHDYGVDPPNATSPSTFSDGELIFQCYLGAVELRFHTEVETGLLSLDVPVYTGGDFLDEIQAQCGYCQGYIYWDLTLDPVPPSGPLPSGYDLAFEGEFMNLFGISVEPSTWGQTKALHR